MRIFSEKAVLFIMSSLMSSLFQNCLGLFGISLPIQDQGIVTVQQSIPQPQPSIVIDTSPQPIPEHTIDVVPVPISIDQQRQEWLNQLQLKLDTAATIIAGADLLLIDAASDEDIVLKFSLTPKTQQIPLSFLDRLGMYDTNFSCIHGQIQFIVDRIASSAQQCYFHLKPQIGDSCIIRVVSQLGIQDEHGHLQAIDHKLLQDFRLIPIRIFINQDVRYDVFSTIKSDELLIEKAQATAQLSGLQIWTQQYRIKGQNSGSIGFRFISLIPRNDQHINSLRLIDLKSNFACDDVKSEGICQDQHMPYYKSESSHHEQWSVLSFINPRIIHRSKMPILELTFEDMMNNQYIYTMDVLGLFLNKEDILMLNPSVEVQAVCGRAVKFIKELYYIRNMIADALPYLGYARKFDDLELLFQEGALSFDDQVLALYQEMVSLRNQSLLWHLELIEGTVIRLIFPAFDELIKYLLYQRAAGIALPQALLDITSQVHLQVPRADAKWLIYHRQYCALVALYHRIHSELQHIQSGLGDDWLAHTCIGLLLFLYKKSWKDLVLRPLFAIEAKFYKLYQREGYDLFLGQAGFISMILCNSNYGSTLNNVVGIQILNLYAQQGALTFHGCTEALIPLQAPYCFQLPILPNSCGKHVLSIKARVLVQETPSLPYTYNIVVVEKTDITYYVTNWEMLIRTADAKSALIQLMLNPPNDLTHQQKDAYLFLPHALIEYHTIGFTAQLVNAYDNTSVLPCSLWIGANQFYLKDIQFNLQDLANKPTEIRFVVQDHLMGGRYLVCLDPILMLIHQLSGHENEQLIQATEHYYALSAILNTALRTKPRPQYWPEIQQRYIQVVKNYEQYLQKLLTEGSSVEQLRNLLIKRLLVCVGQQAILITSI